ncbi:MAG: hypothetical protein MZV64_62970 [Ignavibacteriales bacterium]|nr:hypothetical protein [Ignavibacteriales bacterium]
MRRIQYELIRSFKIEMTIRDAYNKPLGELPKGIELLVQDPDSSIVNQLFIREWKVHHGVYATESGSYSIIAKNELEESQSILQSL